MESYKQEAKRSQDAKLAKYKKFAHGGRVSDDWENSKKDKILDAAEEKVGIKEGSKADEQIDKAAIKHRAAGGPIAEGGDKPRLGRSRKGSGKKGTTVNVVLAKGGSDAPTPPPAALGAGPLPGGPIPGGPRPMPAPGPMKRGGRVAKKK